MYVIDRFKPSASLSFALTSQYVSKAAPHYATKPRALWLSLQVWLRSGGASRVMFLATFFLCEETALTKETADMMQSQDVPPLPC